MRRGRRVVQETVACLGELDEHGRAQARRLALEITGECELTGCEFQAPQKCLRLIRVYAINFML